MFLSSFEKFSFSSHLFHFRFHQVCQEASRSVFSTSRSPYFSAGPMFGPSLLVESSSIDLCGDVTNWKRDGFDSVTGKLVGNHLSLNLMAFWWIMDSSTLLILELLLPSHWMKTWTSPLMRTLFNILKMQVAF